ncbi:hypothetical protein [Photorhabdus australis]|uniref:hypothetical protein n=1 Tax=Photorhabdus australis TaxID=286156 RepID=UPI0030DCF395
MSKSLNGPIGPLIIPVVFQVSSLLATLAYLGHIVYHAPGIHSFTVAMHLEIHRVYTRNH